MRRGRLAAAVILLAWSVTVAGTSAQVDVGSELDTPLTPVGKETDLWKTLAGQSFRTGELVPGSVTPVEADLFDVSFRNQRRGFAGGAVCEQPASPGLDEAALADYLAGCRRVPVIYAYVEDDQGNFTWSEAYRAPAEAGRGFVGSIAWISPTQALAVGGTGEFPRREKDRLSDESDDAYWQRDAEGTGGDLESTEDAAGEARVWRFSSGNWEEITPELPPDIGGLSALECLPESGADECWAGGLAQLVHWQDGQFTDLVRPAAVKGGNLWRYRVREIRYVVIPQVGYEQPTWMAVTSGCCAESPAESVPVFLALDMTGQPPTWAATSLGGNLPQYTDAGSGLAKQLPNVTLDFIRGLTDGAGEPAKGTAGDALDAAEGATGPVGEAFGSAEGAVEAAAVGELRKTGVRPGVDSVYSFIGKSNANSSGGVVTYGGPERDLEPPSAVGSLSPLTPAPAGSYGGNVSSPGVNQNGQKVYIGQAVATTSRLVSGDGDVAGFVGNEDPDYVPDWAVGELRSTGQALALGTTLDSPDSGGYPGDTGVHPDTASPAGTRIDPTEAQRAHRSYRHFLLDAFPLNAVEVIDPGGLGWAVGDRGGIVRLDEGQSELARREPEPPRLGSRTPAPRQNLVPYAPARPPAPEGPVGPVPAQEEQTEMVESQVPFTWAGSAPHPEMSTDSVRSLSELVVSRDGSEGWSFTNLGEPFGAFHFDGSTWRQCDPLGVPGQVPPDPACAGLAELAREGEPITAVARVPLERDSDPSNDDEFELVALSNAKGKTADKVPDVRLFRFRDGRWFAAEDPGFPEVFNTNNVHGPSLSLAFTSPDDGWLARVYPGDRSAEVLHYDGERWVDCLRFSAVIAANAAECGLGAGNAFPVKAPNQANFQALRLTAAGDRLYAYGGRGNTAVGAGSDGTPVIVYRDPGGNWTAADGGFDPGSNADDGSAVAALRKATGVGIGSVLGFVHSVAVRERPEGGFEGWAYASLNASLTPAITLGGEASSVLLRLAPSGQWEPFADPGVSADYMASSFRGQLTLLPGPGPAAALLAPGAGKPGQRILLYDDELGGFRPLPQPFQTGTILTGLEGSQGTPHLIAPDGEGGFFMPASPIQPAGPRSTTFYRYSPEGVPRPVFAEAPHPISGDIRALAAARDGTLWLGGEGGRLARFDPQLGWEELTVPGWDRGRVVTNPAEVNAIAVGPDGTGVAVGEGGRIAQIGSAVHLDRAAGAVVCQPDGEILPCGTGRDLTAAAIEPQGSALVGGRGLSLLFRPAGGEFGAVTKPQAPLAAQVTGISLPNSSTAYISVSSGQLFRGTRSGDDFTWRLENIDEEGDLLTKPGAAAATPLNAVAVDAGGHGFAVGDDGVMLERHPGEARPWKRVPFSLDTDLLTVALPDSGEGALIGGAAGLILTGSERGFSVARPPDSIVPQAGEVSGLAVLPGSGPGEVEAWATLRNRPAVGAKLIVEGSAVLLHHSSDPGDPTRDPAHGVQALPDAPAPRPDELTLGAFGYSRCHGDGKCKELTGSDSLSDLVQKGIVDALEDRSDGPGGLDLAVFTGGASDYAPPPEEERSFSELNRWRDLVANPLQRSGVPVLGAVGSDDTSTRTDNLGWRATMARMPAPWGVADEYSSGDLAVAGVEERPTAHEVPYGETRVEPGQGLRTVSATVPGGPGRTHYAADLVIAGEPVARVAVLDTSNGSLTRSDPHQQPLEPRGGQLDWLDEVTCIRGSLADAEGRCTREPGQRAIVVSSTPTYSPGAATGNLLGDGIQTETILLKNQVDLVVHGGRGLSSRYWAQTQGFHYPEPGGEYTDEAPEALPGQPPPLPFVIAGGAGGILPSNATADAGNWHGYTVVRLPRVAEGSPAGDPGDVIVEQRPIADWLVITAKDHVVRPSKGLALAGFMRQPVGTGGAKGMTTRLERISAPTVTHRYELVQADPAHPWLPLRETGSESEEPTAGSLRVGEEDPCGPYLCLDGSIGRIDDQSGQVKAGRGNYPRTYAVGVLSVGSRVATWPLTFEPRSSFRPPAPPPIRPPALPPPPSSPTQPPQPPPPTVEALVPPVLPNLTAAQPPAPPVPPTPPPAESQTPLDLNLAPTALEVNPPTAVSQPPTPPVNPAPPSGARKEARQRQAAAQKSGADAADETSDVREQAGDLAQDSHSPDQAMTRHDFTAVAHREQPSAWARDALLGGGIGLAALILALGLRTARPTPRRREPEEPAPAWARRRR